MSNEKNEVHIVVEPCRDCGCDMEIDQVYVDDDGAAITEARCPECGAITSVRVSILGRLGDA